MLRPPPNKIKSNQSLTGGKNAAHQVLLARHRADDCVPRAPNAVLHTSPAKPYNSAKRTHVRRAKSQAEHNTTLRFTTEAHLRLEDRKGSALSSSSPPSSPPSPRTFVMIYVMPNRCAALECEVHSLLQLRLTLSRFKCCHGTMLS